MKAPLATPPWSKYTYTLEVAKAAVLDASPLLLGLAISLGKLFHPHFRADGENAFAIRMLLNTNTASINSCFTGEIFTGGGDTLKYFYWQESRIQCRP